MSLPSELGSLASTLDELTRRLSSMADELLGTPDDSVGNALIEIERSLRAGGRRLDRLRRNLS